MIFAAADPPWLVPAICATGIVGMCALVFGLLWFARFVVLCGSDVLKRAYDGVEAHATPHPGDVEVVFHTYFGFLGGGYQSKHRAFLSPAHAETLLQRLHSFNIRWGWFCPGGLFVPFLSYASYRRQIKSIRGLTHAAVR
jgi:hypothetical protein